MPAVRPVTVWLVVVAPLLAMSDQPEAGVSNGVTTTRLEGAWAAPPTTALIWTP